MTFQKNGIKDIIKEENINEINTIENETRRILFLQNTEFENDKQFIRFIWEMKSIKYHLFSIVENFKFCFSFRFRQNIEK